MISLLFFVALSCDTQPPAKQGTLPSLKAVVNTITIKVPADCSHLIVDVVTHAQTDITVACFSQVSRTYLFHEVRPLLWQSEEQSYDKQLKLQYVDDPPVLSSAQ